MFKFLALFALLLAAPALAAGPFRPVIQGVVIDTSSANITASAYRDVVTAANMSYAAQAVQVTNGTSGSIYLATGASGSEALTKYVIPPGINPIIPVPLAAATRVSVKSVAGTLSSGLVTFNFF